MEKVKEHCGLLKAAMGHSDLSPGYNSDGLCEADGLSFLFPTLHPYGLPSC